jgi:nitrogen fixation protein NifU and related proteins
MDRQAQIDFILDHYENPRHYGALADAGAAAQGINPGCGDLVTIYLRADGDGRIEAISFEGDGCTISQAGASMAAEMFAGRTLADVENAPIEVIQDLMGREVTSTRLKCATLGLSTVKEAVRRFRASKAGA